MGQRLLTLRVRPARLAVLINSASSAADFVLAVRFLSQVWGGRFNPILPVLAKDPDPLTEFRLGNNRPDFVFALNLDDSVWEPAVHKACQPRQYVPLDREVAEEIRKDNPRSLIHSDRAIIAKFERRAKPAAISHPLKVVSTASDAELLPYFAAMFGIPPADLNEKYRDEEITFQSCGALDLVNTHKDFVQGWKDSWLDAGSFGLSPHHRMSPPLEPTIVIVRELIQDLCHFWNLRLAADTASPAWIVPVPENHAANADLQTSLRDWVLAFREYGQDPNYCVMTSVSVGRESIKRFAEGLQSQLIGSGIKYVDYVPPKNRLPSIVAFEYTTTWPAELRRQRLTIVPPSPKTFDTSSRSEAWFVDILRDNKTGRAVQDMQLPESTVIPELLNAPCPPSFEHNLVPRFGDGVDAINFHCTSTKDVVQFQVPTATEVLEEIIRDHGYAITADEKRSSYLPTVKRFGGLHMAASAMSGQAGQVLEILRSGRLRSPQEYQQLDDVKHQSVLIAQGHALTPEQIKKFGRLGRGRLGDNHYLDGVEQMLKRENDRVKRVGMARYRRYAHGEVPGEMTLQALLEHWADKSVVMRRWKIGPCSTCGRFSFLDQIDLRKSLRCIHCGNHVPMREFTGVGYTLEPSVRHSLNEGLTTVVLAGRFLRNMTNTGFFWIPGVKYERSGVKGDIDLLACCDGLLIFGECKKLSSTPHNANTWSDATDQFIKLANVAIDCCGAFVVLAALVDSFPADIQLRIETELSGKIPFLLLNKSDLDKGHRPTQPRKEWPPLNLRDLLFTKFPEPQVDRTPGQRQIKFGWSGDTKGAS